MIKPLSITDNPAFSSLSIESGLFPPEAAGFLEQMIADYWERNIHDGHKCVIATDDQDKPVGVAYYEPAKATDRVWYLTLIAIAQETQGKGFGAALMAHIENNLRADGQRMLLVETSRVDEFELTRRFYIKCGYEQEAVVRDYYEAGDDMMLFRKALT